MIGIKLSGGLGNNMFEYASAKSLAISKKYRFCYFSQKDLGFYIKKIKKYLVFKFSRKKDKFKKQLSKKELGNYFYLDQNPFTNLFNKFCWVLKNRHSKKNYIYDFRRNNFIKDAAKKEFLSCERWTELKGCFSSEVYFVERSKILKWFRPKKKYLNKINNIADNLNAPQEKRCCIHIRRGDALYMDKGLALDNHGWSLPLDYYKYVISKLDQKLLFVFLSDDPDWAIDKFDYLPNKIFLKNNSEIIDMFIFSKCKYNILSRGTFSWWGAWLNQIPDKKVFAPKYFLGIPEKKCIPYGMDKGEEVENWNYIDFDDIEYQ